MKKNDGLFLLVTSVAVFLGVAALGVLIEKAVGYDEYTPIVYVI